MTINVFGGGNTGGPAFPVQRSVRLRSSASAYFNRTPATSGNRQIFTISFWMKRGLISTLDVFTGNNANGFVCAFRSDNTLYLYDAGAATGGMQIWSARVFRDPSAWYHVVIAVDTTQATDTNRFKVYINGVQENTATWNVGAGASRYPSLNANFDWNNTNAHKIGTAATYGYFDGYITEFNNVSGYQLDASYFGSINSTTGVWQPIKYSGTYGTNGFYLNFNDNSAATAAAIGKDSSGNGNNWTPNNISVTAGVTYDSMLDVPTLTSANNANYAVLNPIYVIPSNTANTFTNGNLTFAPTQAEGTGQSSAVSTMPLPTTGKWYWEITPSVVSTLSSTRSQVGIMARAQISYVPALNSDCFVYVPSGQKATGNVYTAYGNTYAANDVIGVAVDLDNGAIYFAKNGTWQNSGVPTSGAAKTGAAFTTLTGASEYFPAVGFWGTFNANFGQRPFTYTPPSGFKSLNTYNLPAPTIPNGATQFAATTYTGNGGTQSITNTVNGKSFQPDLVWVKARSVAYNNYLEDSVRGVGKDLSSNLTDAEATYNLLTSFNSNGFTVFTNGTYLASNQNGTTYVGWQWKASNAAAVTNTSGSISSQVSANPSAGFSIVTYTGTASAGATVGHGLNIKPSLIIVKQRTTASTTGWAVYHSSLDSGDSTNSAYLLLNSTNAKADVTTGDAETVFGNGTVWKSPTPSVFTIGANGIVNASSGTYVSYCFSEIAGYSKFGSYTGNGSTDGVFVYLGFRPRFILAKRTDTVSDWWLYDTSRNTYNVISTPLFADLLNVEGNNAVYNLDLLSNGFKWRTADTTMNGSGGTYIYAAFAESPFNYSLAR